MKELQNKLNCTFYLDVCHSDCDFNKLYCGFCKNREEFKGAIDPSEKLNIDLSFFLPQPVTSNQGEVIKICLCNVNVQFGLWQLFSMIRRGWTRITSTNSLPHSPGLTNLWTQNFLWVSVMWSPKTWLEVIKYVGFWKGYRRTPCKRHKNGQYFYIV